MVRAFGDPNFTLLGPGRNVRTSKHPSSGLSACGKRTVHAFGGPNFTLLKPGQNVRTSEYPSGGLSACGNRTVRASRGLNFPLLGLGQNVQMSKHPNSRMVHRVGRMVRSKTSLTGLYNQSDRFSQIYSANLELCQFLVSTYRTTDGCRGAEIQIDAGEQRG